MLVYKVIMSVVRNIYVSFCIAVLSIVVCLFIKIKVKFIYHLYAADYELYTTEKLPIKVAQCVKQFMKNHPYPEASKQISIDM